MRRLFLALLASAAVLSISAKKSQTTDPVAMVVGPDTITLSDFEYLYKKNMQQQSGNLTLDQYVDMFVNYRLKVLAAKDAGEDQSDTYRQDMDKYTAELAAPYMRATEVDDSLVNAAYAHYLYDSEVSHIIIPIRTETRSEAQQMQLLDSLRQCVAAGEDFGALAARYSNDRNAATHHGYIGFVTGGMYPYEFESAACETPVGEISKPVKSPYGMHLIKVHSRRPDIGKAKARHILKLTRGVSDSEKLQKREQIDSIYSVLLAGADFAAAAQAESDDNSRSKGGELPWISSGRTFPEFEKALFALQPGEMSPVIESPAGYHIILCEDRQGVAPLDSMRTDLLTAIHNSPRKQLAIDRAIEKYAKSIGAGINNKNLAKVNKMINKAGRLDAKTRATIAGDEAYRVAGKRYKVADVLAEIPDSVTDPVQASALFGGKLNTLYHNDVKAHMMASLPKREPSYRHLVQEYSDGMLLFEISNKRVWEKSVADLDGLEDFYNSHREKYTWSKPHYKGYVINAKSDSIADAAVLYLANADFAPETYTTELRKKFGNVVKIDRVLAGQGESPIIDHLVFGGEMPQQPKGRWIAFRAFGGEVLAQPTCALDVKGSVSLDYQQQLEAQWLDELKNKYDVKINREVIDQLR